MIEGRKGALAFVPPSLAIPARGGALYCRNGKTRIRFRADSPQQETTKLFIFHSHATPILAQTPQINHGFPIQAHRFVSLR